VPIEGGTAEDGDWCNATSSAVALTIVVALDKQASACALAEM
jgi:hypothetical protein